MVSLRSLIFAATALFALSAGAEPGVKTFGWVTQNMHFYDAPRLGNESIKGQLESSIQRELERKGLKFVSSIDTADLALSYVAVLENAAEPDEVAVFWAENPDIAQNPDRPHKFERGMLFVKLADKATNKTVWKNTYRGLVALDMPDSPRQKRLHQIVVSLLASYTPQIR